MWYRQQSGSLDLAEVPAQVAALQGAISLAKQANEGHRFSPAELQQAAQPLQVPARPEAQCLLQCCNNMLLHARCSQQKSLGVQTFMWDLYWPNVTSR